MTDKSSDTILSLKVTNTITGKWVMSAVARRFGLLSCVGGGCRVQTVCVCVCTRAIATGCSSVVNLSPSVRGGGRLATLE